MRARIPLLPIAAALLLVAAMWPAMAASPRTATPAAVARSVTVVNRATRAIKEVHISPDGEESWGGDKLTGGVLARGGSRSIALGSASGCRYDIQVLYDDDAVEDRRGVDICRTRQLAFDGSEAVTPNRATTDLVFTNRSTRRIQKLLVAPANAANWGTDWLGDSVLAVRGQHTIAYRGDCSADIRVVFDNGSAEERHGVDVCATNAVTIVPGWTTVDPGDEVATATAPPGRPGVGQAAGVVVVNRSGKTLNALHLYPEGTSDQGADLLGADTLDDRAEMKLDLDTRTQCRFTMSASFQEEEDDKVRHNLDLCATPRLVLSASMLIDGKISNAGPLPIVELYVDAPGAPRGPDRLGDGVIAREATFSLSPPVEGMCRYSVVGVFRDGREAAVETDLCKPKPTVLR